MLPLIKPIILTNQPSLGTLPFLLLLNFSFASPQALKMSQDPGTYERRNALNTATDFKSKVEALLKMDSSIEAFCKFDYMLGTSRKCYF